jgi:cyclopropane fatty-acyl-phospholipid synthase-like methyltransferase
MKKINPVPFSEACERNQAPILAVLADVFSGARQVLEIGSGTGQHAVFLATHLPHVVWQPTDLAECLPGLQARLVLEAPGNVRDALPLDVTDHPWPDALTGGEIDAVFSANTLHIMSWNAVMSFFERLGEVAAGACRLCIYGPFRYDDTFTTPSNARFDQWLKARDSRSGVRDFEAVDALARTQGFRLVADHAMPANNQMLVWGK